MRRFRQIKVAVFLATSTVLFGGIVFLLASWFATFHELLLRLDIAESGEIYGKNPIAGVVPDPQARALAPLVKELREIELSGESIRRILPNLRGNESIANLTISRSSVNAHEMRYMYDLKGLEKLSFLNVHFSADAFRILAENPPCEDINLVRVEGFTEEDILTLATNRGLRGIGFFLFQLPKGVYRRIGSNTALRRIGLGETGAIDADITWLATNRSIESASIAESLASPLALAPIFQLPKLKSMTLVSRSLPRVLLKRIGESERLERLSLQSLRSAPDITMLTALLRLTDLSLRLPGLDDKAVASFAKLPVLERLDIHGSTDLTINSFSGFEGHTTIRTISIEMANIPDPDDIRELLSRLPGSWSQYLNLYTWNRNN